jgi:hypothetical protein
MLSLSYKGRGAACAGQYNGEGIKINWRVAAWEK